MLHKHRTYETITATRTWILSLCVHFLCVYKNQPRDSRCCWDSAVKQEGQLSFLIGSQAEMLWILIDRRTRRWAGPIDPFRFAHSLKEALLPPAEWCNLEERGVLRQPAEPRKSIESWGGSRFFSCRVLFTASIREQRKERVRRVMLLLRPRHFVWKKKKKGKKERRLAGEKGQPNLFWKKVWASLYPNCST